MANTITEAHVKQFADNVIELSQQKGSRLRRTAGQVEEGVVGSSKEFHRLAKTAATKRTVRLAPTPLTPSQHSMRWANLATYDWADAIDGADKVKMLVNPESNYARNGSNALGRSIDDAYIAALLGTAITGVDRDGTQALPAGQKIAHGSAGLTLAKMLAGTELLNAAEVDEEDRFFLYSAAQQTDALQISALTSMDFAIHRAIAEGKAASLLGMEWIRTERLTEDATPDRQCIAYGAQAVGWALAAEIVTRFAERADLNFALQVWLSATFGVVRVEDEAVVEIAMEE